MASRSTDPVKIMTTTETDLGALRTDLQDWFRAQTGDPELRVEDLSRNGSSGMSSVTVLFTTVQTIDGGQVRSEQVLRMEPEESALPVFMEYNLGLQARVMNLVGGNGLVPVPTVHSVEETGQFLGRPFLVMDRVWGIAPEDNPPYVFGSWLMDAEPAERAQLQRNSVAMIAGIHQTPDYEAAFGVEPGQSGQQGLRAERDAMWAYYEWTVASGQRIPLIERTFDWLDANWPATDYASVLCWGDARVGNILYEGMRPAAVLDWEMTTVGPAELDLSWFILFHQIYQDLAEPFGKPGLPDFLRPADVVREYEELSGRTLADMPFHMVFAAMRGAVTLARVKQRTVHFGDVPEPATPDEYVLHHRLLERLITDDYDWGF